MSMPRLALWYAAPPDHDVGAQTRGERILLGDTQESDQAESDHALIAQMKADNALALETLYHRHFEALWRFARYLLRTSDGATDAVQDVFTALWIGRATLEIGATVRGYLFTAVRNRAHHRTRDLSTFRRKEELLSNDASGVWRGYASPQASQTVERRELEEAVALLLSKLPERQRLAVELRWTHEMSYAEAARVMEISQPAVRKLIEKVARQLVELRRTYEV